MQIMMRVSKAKPLNTPGHGNQVQAIVATLLIVLGAFLGGGSLASDQTLSCSTIDEGGMQRVCNHRVQQASWPVQNIENRTSVGRSLQSAIRPVFSKRDLRLASLAMMFYTYGMRSWWQMVCSSCLQVTWSPYRSITCGRHFKQWMAGHVFKTSRNSTTHWKWRGGMVSPK